MINEGAEAPAFELPAVVEGEVESVALEEYIGSDVVVLAFYPADFNPACDGTATDLDDLDLFTMQKDVSVLAVSADSVYSHRAFADEYDLHIPLLSDTRGTVAADYGVAVDDPTAGYRNRRAVFVVSPGGDVEFGWSSDDLEQLPPVDAIREAVDDVGGTETARARYRMGHAHYVEGRRSFTSAMGGFRDEEWMVAQGDFMRAFEEFDEATDQFNSAHRFGDDDHELAYYRVAEDKAELLWQAAEWLAKSANAYASGEGAEGQSLRGDAERTLEKARGLFEPPDPDEFPPEEPVEERLDEPVEEGESILPDDEEDVDTALDVDFDAAPAHADDEVTEEVDDQDVPADGASASAEAGGDEDGDGEAGEGKDGDEDADEAEEIDEAELDEITAELEQQTEDARRAREAAEEAGEEAGEGHDADGEPAGKGEGSDRGIEGAGASTPGDGTADDGEESDDQSGGEEPDDHSRGEAPGDGADGDEAGATDDVELELTDPTGGEGLDPIEDEEDATADAEGGGGAGGGGEDGDGEDGERKDGDEDDDDLGDGDHGVPDSL